MRFTVRMYVCFINDCTKGLLYTVPQGFLGRGISSIYTKLYECTFRTSTGSDGVKDMTRKAKAKAKDLTCHAALKPQTLYTVQC